MYIYHRLYITQHFIAFSGWPETRLLLALQFMSTIEKTNTLYYVPNAIVITTNDKKEDYFFASFIDRDYCYNLLVQLQSVAKRLMDLHGPNAILEDKNLILGK